MYCVKCSKELQVDDKYCSNCGIEILKEIASNKVNIISNGSNSPNIGNGMNNTIKIDTLHIGNEQNSKIANYETVIKGFRINQNSVTKISILSIIVGAVGFIGSVITIIESKFMSLVGIMPLLIISAILLLLGEIIFFFFLKPLSKEKFAYIKLHRMLPSMKVLLDEDGIIYFADIKGDCPKCGGQLKLCRNENTYKVYGICNRNRDHKYKFDHTRFIGTEVE